MVGVKITERDLTGGGRGGRQGGAGVKPTEKDLTGGNAKPDGAPGVKVTENDLTKPDENKK